MQGRKCRGEAHRVGKSEVAISLQAFKLFGVPAATPAISHRVLVLDLPCGGVSITQYLGYYFSKVLEEMNHLLYFFFPGSSAGKESACNAGDPGSILRSGRSPGEGIGCPLQCSWASLASQKVKNLPAMWETWVHSLGWEDPLEKGMATHSRILAWRIPMDRGAWRALQSMGSQRLRHAERLNASQHSLLLVQLCICECISMFVCNHIGVCRHGLCIYI